MPDTVTLTPVYSDHAYTRNPLMLTMAYSGRVIFSVYGQGYTQAAPAYSGEVKGPAVVNVAELLEAIVPKMADPGGSTEMLVQLETNNSVTVEAIEPDEQGQQEDVVYSFPIIAHVGGISKQNYRRLLADETDIFAARFLNSGCNFFLTTRTADWRLVVKETEIYPLAFFYPATGTLRIKELAGGRYLSINGVAGKLYALNIAAVRKYFYTENDIIVNAFDVYVDNGYACRIAIEEAPATRERCRLKFRNSYGAFEIVEITGQAQIAPTFGDDEDGGSYKRYAQDLDDFSLERPRVPMTEVINISTGFKNNRELRFILDALASDEVYLLDYTDEPLRVVVTAEGLGYKRKPNGPQAFNLVITPAVDEQNITELITDETTGSRGRIFTDEFSEHFN